MPTGSARTRGRGTSARSAPRPAPPRRRRGCSCARGSHSRTSGCPALQTPRRGSKHICMSATHTLPGLLTPCVLHALMHQACRATQRGPQPCKSARRRRCCTRCRGCCPGFIPGGRPRAPIMEKATVPATPHSARVRAAAGRPPARCAATPSINSSAPSAQRRTSARAAAPCLVTCWKASQTLGHMP